MKLTERFAKASETVLAARNAKAMTRNPKEMIMTESRNHQIAILKREYELELQVIDEWNVAIGPMPLEDLGKDEQTEVTGGTVPENTMSNRYKRGWKEYLAVVSCISWDMIKLCKNAMDDPEGEGYDKLRRTPQEEHKDYSNLLSTARTPSAQLLLEREVQDRKDYLETLGENP